LNGSAIREGKASQFNGDLSIASVPLVVGRVITRLYLVPISFATL
jgi:hypothetical protein